MLRTRGFVSPSFVQPGTQRKVAEQLVDLVRLPVSCLDRKPHELSGGEKPAASLTLLTTLLDSTHPGVLGIFIDEMQLALREGTIGQRGIMPGKDLALTFNFLRPNELVWNYVVGNYLAT